MSTRAGPAFEERAADWLEPWEAQRRILEGCRPLPCERTPLRQALGRALAEDVYADVTLPPWDNAGMDGYAVRSEDVRGASPATPVVLAVRSTVRAGAAAQGSVRSGEAVRIMTGAPLPEGADSVVRVEDTDAEAEPGLVRILRDRDAGASVRPAGQDARPGDKVLEAGHAIGPGAIGALAAMGRSEVLVRRRPVVAILVTGDELRSTERYEDVRRGLGVPDTNGPMLAAATSTAEAVPTLLGIATDDRVALQAAVERASGADALVTVGGASMGEADLVKRVLDEMGLRLEFWRVRMRPGSPFSFGWLPRRGGEQAVFGLPGNPASAFVTFELFVRPYLLRAAGHSRIHRRRIVGRAGEEMHGGNRTQFVRVRLEGVGPEVWARRTGPQGSGLVRGLAAAEGLAIVPTGSRIAAGDPVDVIVLDGGIADPILTSPEGPPS